MILTKIDFYENKENGNYWEIKDVNLDMFNLIIGLNATGKTRLVNAIARFARTLTGKKSHLKDGNGYPIDKIDGAARKIPGTPGDTFISFVQEIAIFVEGQTERIFMVRFLSEYLGDKKIETRIEKNLGNRGVKYIEMRKNPYAEFYILVYDVGVDSNVVSAVKERAEKTINRAGYSWLLALRDLYPNLREEK